MTKGDKAKELFMSGYTCAQAVLCAFSEETGLDEQTLKAVASSFGGGMGRLREVCGTVSGMLMVAGLLYGNDTPKAEHYRLVQALAKEFKDINGSYICRELLGVPGAESPVPEKRTPEYYKKRPCPELCRIAGDIMEKYIREKENV